MSRLDIEIILHYKINNSENTKYDLIATRYDDEIPGSKL